VRGKQAGFPDLGAEEIEAGSTDLSPPKELNSFQRRSVEREHALNALPVREASDRHGRRESSTSSSNHETFKGGQTYPIPFHDSTPNPNLVPWV
jgi:hypothetical protein